MNDRRAWLEKHPLYEVWASMKKRCYTPSTPTYPHYGGRGIEVCARWRNSYDLFVADMGPRPAGASLDRIDNNGNYCPENCRWAYGRTQHNNKRSNRRLIIGGRTQTLSDWAREAGLHKNTLQSRVAMGWPEDRLLSSPRGFVVKHQEGIDKENSSDR